MEARDKARGKEIGARRGVTKARSDYEATTRGIGELQAQADTARRDGDTGRAQLIDTRLATATERVNADAATRQAKVGRPTGDYTYAALPTGEMVPDTPDKHYGLDAATRQVHQQGVTGSVKTFQAGTKEASKFGGNQQLQVVTLTRTDRNGDLHEATFKIATSPRATEPMTCAGAVATLNERAGDHNVSAGNFEEWRQVKDYPTKADNPARFAAAQAEYECHGADARKLKEFFRVPSAPKRG